MEQIMNLFYSIKGPGPGRVHHESMRHARQTALELEEASKRIHSLSFGVARIFCWRFKCEAGKMEVVPHAVNNLPNNELVAANGNQIALQQVN